MNKLSPFDIFPDLKVSRPAGRLPPLTLLRKCLDGPFLDLRVAAVRVIRGAVMSSETFKQCAKRLHCKDRALRQFRKDFPEYFKAAFMGTTPKKIRKIY